MSQEIQENRRVETAGTLARIAGLPQFATRSRFRRLLHANRWRLGIALEAVFIVSMWWLLTLLGVLPRSFLPTPPEVVNALIELAGDDVMWTNAAFTMQNFFLGLVIAILIGIPVGMAIGGLESLHMFFGPVVWTLYAVPLLAIAPVIVLVFGLGAESKVLVVVLMAVFPIVINTMQGVRAVPPDLVSAARVFGGTRRDVALKVTFPSLLPYLFVGLRLGVSGGIAGALLAEFVGSYFGLGLMLSQSAFVFNVARMIALVVIVVVIAAVALGVLQRMKARFSPWATDTWS